MKGKGRNEAVRALNNRSAVFSEEPAIADLQNNKSNRKSRASNRKFIDDFGSTDMYETAVDGNGRSSKE